MSLSKSDKEHTFAYIQPKKYNESNYIIKNNILMEESYKEKESLPFGRTIIRSFSESPDFVGMIDAETEEKVTFAEMKDRSIRCALWLRKHSVNENDIVAISTDVQMSDYVPYLATLYINAIVNPWYYNAEEENAQHCFDTCPPKVMFACEQSIDKLTAIAKKKGIDCKFVAFKKHSEHISLEEILAEQTPHEVENFRCNEPSDPKKKLSLLIYSSGTTSAPKTIMLSNHSLMTRQIKSHTSCDFTYLSYSPFAWINWSTNTILCICRGFTRIVHRKFDVEFSAYLVDKYKVNLLSVRPYFLMLWHQANVFSRYNFTHPMIIALGGTKASEILLKSMQKNSSNITVRNFYGMTETGGYVTSQTKDCKHIDSIGFVSPGVQLKFVDPNSGALLGPNQQGEIYVKAETNMMGYFGNDEETKKTIDEDGWLRTGDLGHYDEDGEIMIGDRLKAVIKIRSYSLSPSEAEDLLMHHPAVEDCAIVAVDHPTDVERPFIFIVKTHGAQVTAEELIDLVSSKNEIYRLTSGLVFVDKLPYTLSGKKWLMKLLGMAKAYVPVSNQNGRSRVV